MAVLGTEKNDVLVGGAGDDTIYGLGGADKLTGNAGDDVLAGNAGNDTLQGGDGDDYLLGGAGNDTLEGGNGVDWAAYEDATSGVTVNLALTANQNTGGGGTDKLTSIENVYGSAFNDVLTGDANTNNLAGDAGSDTLSGAAGDDNLFGGAGHDSLLGGQGDDYIQGGAGNDTIDGGAGSDWAAYDDATSGVTVNLTLTAAQNTGGGGVDKLVGVENVYGSVFDDVLTGDANANTLIGDAGNDSLSGGAGDDFIQGGAGADVINGGEGHDTVSYEGAAAGVYIDLAQVTQTVVGWAEAGDELTSIEALIGSDFNDVFFGNAAENYLAGGAGNDLMQGVGGNDVLDGGDGDDRLLTSWQSNGEYLSGGAGADVLVLSDQGTATLDAGDGNDNIQIGGYAAEVVVAGGAGVDTIYFANAHTQGQGAVVDLRIQTAQQVGDQVVATITGVENASGSLWNDHLTGDDGANVLRGDAGADTLLGGAGNDVLKGGAGDDVIDGGEGFDIVSYLGDGLATGVQVQLWKSWQDGVSDRGHDTLISIEGAEGSAYDDFLQGSSGANILRGGAGNDGIWSMGGADTLEGGDGNDTLSATGLADFTVNSTGAVMLGGAGSDNIMLGLGDMSADGGTGDDFFQLNNIAGHKVLLGGDGADRMDLQVWIGYGVDFTTGVTLDLSSAAPQQLSSIMSVTIDSIEKVNGTAFNDQLTGSAADNFLGGGAGSDLLVGGAGSDTLDGGVDGGNDTLNGGTGHDEMWGGSGADTFVFAAGDSLTGNVGGADVIGDFQAGDEIRLGDMSYPFYYAELTATDFASAQTQAHDYLQSLAMNKVALAIQVGGDVYVFSGQSVDHTAPEFNNVILLQGTNLNAIDTFSFF